MRSSGLVRQIHSASGRGRTRFWPQLSRFSLSSGDLEGATGAFRDSFEMRRALADELAGNTEARRDVAVALEKLGEVLLAPDRPQEAFEELSHSFAIP